jgi:hypothetical protein
MTAPTTRAEARAARRHTHQLLLDRLLEQVAPGDRHTDRGALERLLLAIANVLYRQDLTFSTYVLLQATGDAGGPITLANLAREVGFSYHATRNQIVRSPWFQVGPADPLVTVTLNPDGTNKLARVTAALHQHLGTA